MFKSISPTQIVNFIEKELYNELFYPNGDLRVNISDYTKFSKKKTPNKVVVGNHNGEIIYGPWKLWELGYNGSVYKLAIAIHDDSQQVVVSGFIDSNSSFPIIVSNFSWPESSLDNISKFRKNGVLNIDRNIYYGLQGLLRLY